MKSAWGPYIIAAVRYQPTPKGKIYARQVQMKVDHAQWGQKKWHHVAITWDQDRVKLFIDGIHPQQPKRLGVPRFWKNKPAPPDHPLDTTPKFPDPLPDFSPDGRIYIGDIFGSKKAPESLRTAIDEVKIYNRPLNAKEMLQEYERIMPPVKNIRQIPHLITVPKGSTGSVALIRRPMGKPTNRISGQVSCRHDGKFVYFDFHAGFPCLVRKAATRDGKLWEDDSFELHLESPANERFQFIVNGNGALFDAKNKDKMWSPADIKVKSELKKDSWCASIAIPVSVLGGKLDGTWKADFAMAQQVPNKTNYYRWSDIVFDNSFTATGELRFLNRADYFIPRFAKPVESGNLDLTVDTVKSVNVKASYTPKGQPATPYPGNMRSWQLKMPTGNVRLNLDGFKGKTQLYRYYTDTYIEYPMELSFNTVTKLQKTDVCVDFSNADGEFLKKLSKGISGTVALTDASGKELSSAEFNTSQIKSDVSIKLPGNLTKGTYFLTAKSGNLTRTIEYRVPDMLPYKMKLGKDHTVPAPWHPVKKIDARRYAVLDRIFVFDGVSPLPEQLIVKGENILSKRPELLVDGKSIKWQNWRTLETNPDYIRFAADGKCDKGKVNFTAELHFDGMFLMNYSLDVPETESFVLTAGVKAQFAKFALDPYLMQWQNNVSGIDIRNIKNRGNIIWLTGHEKGLCFFSNSTKNWYNTPGEKQMMLKRDASQVTFYARMISKKAKLPRPADYVFIIQPTPPRRPGKGGHNINFCSYGNSSECNYDFTQGGKSRINSSPMTGVIPKYPDDYNRQYKKGYKARIITYTLPGHINEMEPDFDYWDKNNRNLPGTTHSGVFLGQPWTVWQYCNNASEEPADLWTYWADFTARRHKGKFGGLYFDVATIRNCENAAHGCGGVDMFGQKYFTNDALGMRNFLLRTYKTMQKHNCIMILHCHVAYIPFTHDFLDSFAPGENTFAAACRNLWYTYTDEIPPEIYQSELNWRKAGVPYAMIFQQGRVCDLLPSAKKHKREILDNPEYALRSLTAMSVHELNFWCHGVNRPTLTRFWKLRREIKVDAAKDYHGYWRSDAVKSASGKVYCGWYEWDASAKAPYRRVLIISNFNRTPVKAALTIDWKKLGIAPVKEFVDLWENKTVSADELASYTLPGVRFLILGIK